VLLGTWLCCALDAVKCSQQHAFQGIIMQLRIALVLVHMDRAQWLSVMPVSFWTVWHRARHTAQLVGTLTAANSLGVLTAA
jgi:hypothetical protein